MEYNWSIDDIKKQIIVLKECLKRENDPDKIQYYKYVIEQVKLYCENEKSRKIIVSNNTMLAQIANEYLVSKDYYSLIMRFFDILSPYQDKLNDIGDRLDYAYKRKKISFYDTPPSLSSVLNYVDGFYKGFDSELYSYFKEAFDDRSSTLKIVRKRKGENTVANTLFIDCVRKNFITIYSSSFFEDYISLVHEYGHATANLINPLRSMLADEYFADVQSIFPELVASFENQPNFSKSDLVYYNYSNLVTYFELAEYLVLHTPIINEWEENKKNDSLRFYHNLFKCFGLRKKDIESSISTDIEQDGCYVLSYALSLKLLNIYKKDKRKALIIFKDILNTPYNISVLSRIEKSDFSCINDEISGIIDDMELVLKKRGL